MIKTIIGSDNGLSSIRRHVIIWTYTGVFVRYSHRNNLCWNFNQNTTLIFKNYSSQNVICKEALFCLGLTGLNPGHSSAQKSERSLIKLTNHRRLFSYAVGFSPDILLVFPLLFETWLTTGVFIRRLPRIITRTGTDLMDITTGVTNISLITIITEQKCANLFSDLWSY